MSENKVKLLSAEDILNADDLKFEVVEVPEWGGSVRIRTMSNFEQDEFEAMISRQSTGVGASFKTDTRGLKLKLLALTLVNEEGKPLFTDKQIRQLEKKSGRATNDVYRVASKLNGLGEEELKKIAKNLLGGPDAATGSSSPGK